jgi:TRAP-type C4-dicarboxylate transport system permease large subunit
MATTSFADGHAQSWDMPMAAAATLGLMIPPSLTLIVYGVSINESIIKLFMAGIILGLVLAALFKFYIMAWHVL